MFRTMGRRSLTAKLGAICALLVLGGTAATGCGPEESFDCYRTPGAAGCFCRFGEPLEGESPLDDCSLDDVDTSDAYEGQAAFCCAPNGYSETSGVCFCGLEQEKNGCPSSRPNQVDACAPISGGGDGPGSSGPGGESPCDASSYTYCGDSSDDDKPCFSGLDCSIINSSGTQRCTISCETGDDCNFAGLSGECSCGSSEFGCNCLFTSCEAE